MGEKKRRIDTFGNRANRVKEFINAYQYSLRALVRSLPTTQKMPSPKGFAVIGLCEIWPCRDAAVVLLYQNPSNDIEVAVKDPLQRTAGGLLQDPRIAGLYDEHGKLGNLPGSLQFMFFHSDDASGIVQHFADISMTLGNVEHRTKFQRGMVLGWDVPLEKPDELALQDFRAEFVARNIVGTESEELPAQEARRLAAQDISNLAKEFQALLDTAESEEQLQQFLKAHPELIHPDHITCRPKFELGKELETDYVFHVQGLSGLEYVFVEIESATKKVFTQGGQFSSAFTQAKNQLLDWERWITQNLAYASRDLPDLYAPRFHLVMGRSRDLNTQQREKLKTEFASTSREFSTYDDLVERFLKVVERVLQAS
jgi:hypothetical protein